MRKHVRRPSPALVVSLIALFVALGGVGYAAVAINGKNLMNKSVAGKKLKNKTITGGKVKSNTLGGAQINESKLGKVPSATNADQATNATTAGNADKLDGKDSSDFGPMAFARINGTTATVVAGSEKNLTNGNVVRPPGFPTGVYCFGGFNPAPKSIIAQHANDTFDLNISSEIGGDTAALCPATHEQGHVVLYDDTTVVNHDFYVLFN